VECPKASLEWFKILQTDLPEDDEPWLMISVYAYKISSILPRIRRLMANCDDEEEFSLAATILAECDEMEAETLTWMNSERVSSKSYPGNLPMLPIWNMYRCLRGKLHSSLLEFFGLLGKSQTRLFDHQTILQRRQSSFAIVLDMADGIVNSIPYALGDPSTLEDNFKTTRPRSWSDALRLMWPLRVVSFSPLALPYQREIANVALRQIGHEMGIGQALSQLCR
jgi:hypothetical protein